MSLTARHALLALLVGLVALPPGPAAAKDEEDAFPETYKMHRVSFEAALQKDDPAVLAKAIGNLAAAAAKTQQQDVLKDARKLIKPHLKYRKKREAACTAAVKAYGVLRIEHSARDLLALGEEKRSKRIPKALRAHALYSIARIADRKTHDVILDYLDAPKPDKTALYMAVAASKAIGLYAALDPKRKYAVMYDVMRKWGDLFSAAGGAFMTSADAAEWWGATHKPLVTSFNKVLGQQFTTYKDCEKWWRKNRKKVQRGAW